MDMLINHGNNPAPWGGILGVSYAAWPPAPPPPVVVPQSEPIEEQPRPVEAAPAPVPPPPPSPRSTSDEIYFDGASARLTNIAKAVLDGVALRMKNDLNATAVVTGFTDNTGIETANMELGAKRADGRQGVPRDAARHRPEPDHDRVQGRGRPRLRQRHGRGKGQEPPGPDRGHPHLGNVIARSSARSHRTPSSGGGF